MPQRSIRFPDDLAAWIEAEAARLDRSFSWLVLRTLGREKDRAESNGRAIAATVDERMARKAANEAAAPARRGSPSPSLERFAKPRPKGGKR